MSGFVSPRAKVKGLLSKNAQVYGPTEVGEGCFVDDFTTLGYPSRHRLLKALETRAGGEHEVIDEASLGSFVGPRCIIRRGCVVYDEVVIEGDVELGHNVLVRSGSVIQRGSRIGSSTLLDGAVQVGRDVNIQSNVYIPHLTKISDRVFIAPNVVMTNDPYPVGSPLKGPTIGVGAVIGAGAVILPGVEVGDGAVVGAGSIVTKNVPPRVVVYGVPARQAYTVEEYERKKQTYMKQ
ncbi:MAG: acyltransferase [Candidatus Caldarchaeum sp.]|nr:acyltransferase [Candidatus Caldarchaeum sp.]